MTDQLPGAAARGRGGGWAVFLALAAANGLGYLLSVVAARRLGREGFGALAALLGLVLVGNVLALALQAIVARRTVLARNDPDGVSSLGWAPRLIARCAALAGVVGLAAAVPLTAWLHLGSVAAALLLAATLVPLTAIGGQLGVLQGEERLHALARLYLAAGIGKVGGGLAGVLLTGTVTGTMAGTAAGAWLAMLTGGAQLRRARPPDDARQRSGIPSGVGPEVARATVALGGLFALANLDVVLARHFLDARQAGLYAVGAVLAKGAFWLPSFVPVIAMAGLANPARRRRTAALSLATVAGTGLVVTVSTWLLGSLLVRIVGGGAYAALADRAWLFAATGSTLAVVQLLLYSRLAGEDRRVIVPLWGLVAGEVLVICAWRHDTVADVITTALAAAAAVAALGLVAEWLEHGRPRPRAGGGTADSRPAWYAGGGRA